MRIALFRSLSFGLLVFASGIGSPFALGQSDCANADSVCDALCDSPEEFATPLHDLLIRRKPSSNSAVGCEDSCEAQSCAEASCDDCDTVDCSGACFCCQDQWTVWAETMFLRRSDSASYPLITSQNDGSTLLNANNLEYNHQAVPRIFLIRDYCNCWGWEVGYFGAESWNTTGEGGGDISPVLNGPGIDIGSTEPGTIFQAAYGTDLHNAEFNLRRRVSRCVTWIAGFRFVELRDSLRAGSIAPTNEELYSISAMNQMYGLQTGANAQLINCGGRFHIDGIFRAGVFANHATQTTSSQLGNVIPDSASSLSASSDQGAFVGEVGLRGVYQITQNFGIYGGYTAIWFDGLALAPAQLAQTNLFTSPFAGINTSDGLLFHGATAGLQASF